ncbi:DUF4395 domain-containing protein [Bacillus sp. 2205SS5-2]|uniref:DUF4395 domain-containing protein n=1 Tax=Bacillus sp. 2205SS5-2 TaxID=3109031 RepID=UPI0030068BA0
MGIPKPLVQTNQIFMSLTVLSGLFIHEILLVLPFALGLITIATKKNPLILVGKKFLSKPTSSYILEDADQQIFNQWIATVCLGFSLLFFAIGWTIVAVTFSVMVILASTIAIMGYCIGCTIRYQYKMWQYRRKKTQLHS